MPPLRRTLVRGLLRRALLGRGAGFSAVALLGAVVPAHGILTLDMGAGAGWFDCNNDGYLDVCFLTPDGNIYLMVFDPAQGKFEDRSALAFPPALQGVAAGMGVACVLAIRFLRSLRSLR